MYPPLAVLRLRVAAREVRGYAERSAGWQGRRPVDGAQVKRDAMLVRNSYSQAYIASTRTTLRATVTEYRKLAKSGAPEGDFERQFFNHLVLALEMYFSHRQRGLEGKDGNPLTEVRVLAESIMANDGRLLDDGPVTHAPERSVLGYRAGDLIRLDPDSFTRLCEAFLDEIEVRYR